jgi:hypothetical protein
VALRKAAAADTPALCQAAAERANATAFSIAATATRRPKFFCFWFVGRPANLCGPTDRQAACKYTSLGSFVYEP